MKRRILLLLIFTFLAPVTALRAQGPFPGHSGRLTIRAGHSVHGTDPEWGFPGSALSVGGDYTTGAVLLGGSIDMKNRKERLSTATVRCGFGASGRQFSVSAYMTARYRWNDAYSGWLAGAGGTIDYRLAGPLGVFASLEYAQPLVREARYAYFLYNGQTIFTYGISLRF